MKRAALFLFRPGGVGCRSVRAGMDARGIHVAGPLRDGRGALRHSAYDYPRLRIGMRAGYCAGLAASRDDGLQFPRSIVQVPDRDLFVVADMGGWAPSKGRLLMFDPAQPAGRRIKVLLEKVDYPFGLVIGLDRKVYASTTETDLPLRSARAEPEGQRRDHRPGPAVAQHHAAGRQQGRGKRPPDEGLRLRQDRPALCQCRRADRCLRHQRREQQAVRRGRGRLAACRDLGLHAAARRHLSGVEARRSQSAARDLRAGLAQLHGARDPSAVSDAGFAFLQGENARDLEDPLKPNEEINALEKGRHYGWPYCYDLSTASPEFKPLLQAGGPYKDFCNNSAAYRAPYSLLPPHGAPLGMLYYQGSRFPELNGKLIVGLHGYRPTGSRVIFYDVDAKGFPVISPRAGALQRELRGRAVAAVPDRSRGEAPAAAFTELIGEWHRVNGVRPQGAPVAHDGRLDGAIWLVEDKNATIIRIDKAADQKTEALPCNVRSDRQIDELVGYVMNDKANRERLTQLRTQLVEKHVLRLPFRFRPQAGAER